MQQWEDERVSDMMTKYIRTPRLRHRDGDPEMGLSKARPLTRDLPNKYPIARWGRTTATNSTRSTHMLRHKPQHSKYRGQGPGLGECLG